GCTESVACASPLQARSAFGPAARQPGKGCAGHSLQDRTATAARFRCTHPMITPTLQPFDSRAGTDLKAASRRDATASIASITPSPSHPDSYYAILVARTLESMPIDSIAQTV